MEREAWRATVHGVARVGYNLATKLSHRIINHQMHMACRKINSITQQITLSSSYKIKLERMNLANTSEDCQTVLY